MSIEASVNIKLSKRGNQSISSSQIVRSLINGGWNIKKDGKVLYLPLGDDDDFDWQEDVLSEADFLKLAQEKEQVNEIIGIGLFWNDTETGGTLLLYSDCSISFSATINRKVLMNNITDVNWYLEKIIPCLEIASLGIEHFTFTQV